MGIKHGYARAGKHHPLFDIWCSIKGRCYNSNDVAFKNYGGRGIRVCDEWRNSADQFIEWCLDNGWNKNLWIDRIDNNGNYEPRNCRFVTPKQSSHNQRLIRKNNSSGLRGVSWHNKNRKWIAQICINSKKVHLGYFDSLRLAALAYDGVAYRTDDRPRNIF
jgi:hypothetical protein